MDTPPEYEDATPPEPLDLTSLVTSVSTHLSSGEDGNGQTFLEDPSPTDEEPEDGGNWYDDLDPVPRLDSYSGALSPPDTGNALRSKGKRQDVRFEDDEETAAITDKARPPALDLTKRKTTDTDHAVERYADRSMSAQANDTVNEVMVKLDLLPAIVALQASTRPNSGGHAARRALEAADNAFNNARNRGASASLLGKCLYYIGIARVALGQVDDDPTIHLFEDAARLTPDLSTQAEEWITHVREQQRVRAARQEEMSRRQNSLMSWGPMRILGDLLGSPFSSPAGSNRSSQSSAGLYEHFNNAMPTRPAAGRMVLSSSSGASSRRQAPLLTTKPATTRMALSSSSGASSKRALPTVLRTDTQDSSTTTTRKKPAVSRAAVIAKGEFAPLAAPTQWLPNLIGRTEDSQLDDYVHDSTSPVFSDGRFVSSPSGISPDTYAKYPSPLQALEPRSPVPLRRQNPNQGGEIYHPHRGSYGESDPASSPRAPAALKIVNKGPSTTTTTSSSSSGADRPPQPVDEDDGEDIAQKPRRRSWIGRKLSVNPVSPARSLEALVEEGASPVFSPKEFGMLRKGAKSL